jgi:hypothetical protein
MMFPRMTLQLPFGAIPLSARLFVWRVFDA